MERKEPIVLIEVRNVYGNQLIYPANEEAELFCQIAGKKTLDMNDLCRINKLGFLVVESAKKNALFLGITRAKVSA